MKSKSPSHKLIQLRRKTEKIVLPKTVWDLSNKQNQNSNDVSRQNKNSSKKSSLERFNVKKSPSLTKPNILQFSQNHKKHPGHKKVKQSPYSSVKKSEPHSHQMKNEKQIKSKLTKKNSNKSIFDNINHILAQNYEAESCKAAITNQYWALFTKLKNNSVSQKNIASLMESHVFFWFQKYQEMNHLVRMMGKQTSKYNLGGTQQFSEVSLNMLDDHNLQNQSQTSYCSYIVDPQQQICYRSLKAQQLKDKLHLNLSRVSQIRKKEFREQ